MKIENEVRSLLDPYGRNIHYLRISVTDRCNLRCQYCMPASGVPDLGHANILTLEEIHRVVQAAAMVGVDSVRLTGGEPLVRKNVVQLIRQIAATPHIEDVALTTNGILFAELAQELKQAGLRRVNFSLDTLNAAVFKELTGTDGLQRVLHAISAALELGFGPVKINTVVLRGINEQEVMELAYLAKTMPVHVRFIECMPVGNLEFYREERFVSMQEVKERLAARYELVAGEAPLGNGPAKTYQLRGGQGTVGFISAMSDHFCGACNRLRLTADGRLRSCLFGKEEVNLKPALSRQAGIEEVAALFRQAILAKPERHYMQQGWGADNARKMYQIGG